MKPYTNNSLLNALLSFLSVAFMITLTAHQYDGGTQKHTESLTLGAKKLDANNINTWFRNIGSFNYDPFNQNNPGFEWPKGSGKFARFASGIWIGARVGSDTIVSIADYTSDFRPGYTDDNGNPQGENDPLYRIYKLHLGVNDSDRMSWPNVLLGNSNQGAPVYFQNNSWHPLDFGHQTLFHRYTDSYNTQRLKADVMELDFSVDLPGGLADVAFSQFTVINRSSVTWQNAYITIWTDDDLGFAIDDKVGCDSALNLGYTYNGTSSDPVYGMFPPAVGFLVLRGALLYTGSPNDTVCICRNKVRTCVTGYKDFKMSVFNSYISSNDPCDGNPVSPREVYRYMSGYNRCGQPRINPVGNFPTKYMYSGDPVTSQGWIQSQMGDQRFLVSSGPVNINPGDTQVIVVAQVIAQGINNLFSISRLKELCAVVKYYYNSCYTNPPIGIQPISSEIPSEFRLYQNYPNPFNAVTVIRYELMLNGPVSLKIFDALGREVSVLVNEKQTPGTYEVKWNAADFQSGVYFYRLAAAGFTESRKMVLIK